MTGRGRASVRAFCCRVASGVTARLGLRAATAAGGSLPVAPAPRGRGPPRGRLHFSVQIHLRVLHFKQEWRKALVPCSP